MDWYLTQDWDEKSQIEFEDKIKKSRGSYNKAQYIRIKGSCLIESKETWKQKAGVCLLERVIKDYANEILHSYYAHEQLGDYYRLIGYFEKSIFHYQKVLDYYKEDRNGTSGIADIKYAEVMLDANKKEEYVDLIDLLTVTLRKQKVV